MLTVLMVAAAGAVGVLTRWAMTPAGSPAAPWTTMAINAAGSFALGVLVAQSPSAQLRVVLGVGLLGGFTTFSTFAVDVATAAQQGRAGKAAALAAATLLIGLAAATAGLRLGGHLQAVSVQSKQQ